MRPSWSPATKYTAGIAIAVLGIYTLYLSSSVIPLLIIAALLAVMVRPVISWAQQRLRCSLSLAVTLTYLVVAFIVPLEGAEWQVGDRACRKACAELMRE